MSFKISLLAPFWLLVNSKGREAINLSIICWLIGMRGAFSF